MQKILYMDNEYYLLLEYLIKQCRNDYKLLQVDEVLTALKNQIFLQEENPSQKLFSLLRDLNSECFIDLKYADDEVFLLKPLSKSFILQKPEKPREDVFPPQFEFDKKQLAVLLILIFSLALLGGVLGGLIGGLLC